MSASSAQADFRLLKSRVSLAMVFDHYGGIELRQQGRELRGGCPFCKHEHSPPKSSKDRQRAFAVNPEKQTFYCHACKKGGDIIKFVSEYEGCNLKEAGLNIQEWFRNLFSDDSPPADALEQTAPEQHLSNHTPEQHPATPLDLASLLQEILSELRLIRGHLEKEDARPLP
jgi:hypothetical protein